jgi:hypothetical protein
MYAANGDRGPLAYRDSDSLWIPGDWGYIENIDATSNPDNWKDGFEGENIIYMGNTKFWGHILDKKTTTTIDKWQSYIKTWPNKKGGKTAITKVWNG